MRQQIRQRWIVLLAGLAGGVAIVFFVLSHFVANVGERIVVAMLPVMASLSMHAGRLFDELAALPAMKAFAGRPIFLIHGRDDQMIDPANLDILFNAAGEPKQKWLGPGPHSNILTTEFDEYQRRVLKFFKQADVSVARHPATSQAATNVSPR